MDSSVDLVEESSGLAICVDVLASDMVGDREKTSREESRGRGKQGVA